MQVDLDTLRQRVIDATQKSPLAAHVENVTIEADRDAEGADFLRVILQIKDRGNPDEADFESLLEKIERAVGDVDDRYPSVRFSDAA
ncbi:MAG TPA: hypothetical protein VMF86_11505 [Stellaceae bacterium]|nr:hypothetical protein [Stellaceae bacterium]